MLNHWSLFCCSSHHIRVIFCLNLKFKIYAKYTFFDLKRNNWEIRWSRQCEKKCIFLKFVNYSPPLPHTHTHKDFFLVDYYAIKATERFIKKGNKDLPVWCLLHFHPKYCLIIKKLVLRDIFCYSVFILQILFFYNYRKTE